MRFVTGLTGIVLLLNILSTTRVESSASDLILADFIETLQDVYRNKREAEGALPLSGLLKHFRHNDEDSKWKRNFNLLSSLVHYMDELSNGEARVDHVESKMNDEGATRKYKLLSTLIKYLDSRPYRSSSSRGYHGKKRKEINNREASDKLFPIVETESKVKTNKNIAKELEESSKSKADAENKKSEIIEELKDAPVKKKEITDNEELIKTSQEDESKIDNKRKEITTKDEKQKDVKKGKRHEDDEKTSEFSEDKKKQDSQPSDSSSSLAYHGKRAQDDNKDKKEIIKILKDLNKILEKRLARQITKEEAKK